MKNITEQNPINIDEKREDIRMHFDDIPVLYHGSRPENARGRVHDISKSGMFLETDTLEEVGDYIEADLDARNLGKIIWVQGKVVRATKHGIGIQFTHMDRKGIETIISIQK